MSCTYIIKKIIYENFHFAIISDILIPTSRVLGPKPNNAIPSSIIRLLFLPALVKFNPVFKIKSSEEEKLLKVLLVTIT